MPASTSETRVVPGAYDGVFHAVCHAATSSGMTVTLADPAAGVIQTSTSMGLATRGKNRQNIETLFGVIARPPAGAWYPDPSGRHELRWWDGTRWTDTVSDHGQVSADGQ